jgi:hypothetical protein
LSGIFRMPDDFLPQRLAVTVVREEIRRLPYRWEVVYVLGNGRVRIYCALGVWVFVKTFLTKSDKGHSER